VPASRLGSRLRTSGARGRILVSLADQATSSFGNFFVILAAVRLLDPTEVGRFTVAQLIFVTALGIEQALVGDILLVNDATQDRPSPRELARGAASAAVLIGLVTACIYVPVGTTVLHQSVGQALLLGLLAVPFVVQDALRYLLVSTGRPGAALANDLVWTISTVVAVIAGAAGRSPTPVRILLIWLVTGACCAVGAVVQARATLSFPAAIRWFRRHRQVSRRFLVEYISITGSFQVVVYVLAGTAGLAASGALRGATAIFGPLHTVFTGAKLAVVPELARVRTRTGARRASLRISLLLGSIAVIYGGILVALPNSIGERGLGHNFALLAPLFPLLAVHKIADAVATGPFTVLRSHERTRRTAQGRVAVALLGILGGVTGACFGSARAAELGLASASVIGCVLWRLLLTSAPIASGTAESSLPTNPLPAGFRMLKFGRTEVVALPADRTSRRLGVALTKAISRREEMALRTAALLDRLGAWRIVSSEIAFEGNRFDDDHHGALAQVLASTEGTPLRVVAQRRPRDASRQRSYLYLGSEAGRHRFAKVVSGPSEQLALEHEHQVLRALSDELASDALRVPAAAQLHVLDKRSSVLLTDALPTDCRPAPGSVRLLDRIVSEYARVCGSGVPDWLTAEALSTPEVAGVLRARGLSADADRFVLEQSEVGLGRVHGDLSPANVYVSPSAWWVIDWERSLSMAPVGTDFFLWPGRDLRATIDRPQSSTLAALPRADRVAAAITAVLLREKLLIPAQREGSADSEREPATT
jgi:hypothetical protein